MVYFSDSPSFDFLRHDADQAERLKKLPVCNGCGERIQDDWYFHIEGEDYCDECARRVFGRAVEVEWD